MQKKIEALPLIELDDQQMKDLRKKQLELLNIFIQVCSDLHLSYCLIGGTLLGAVRHGGYIPWDDDIDVAMPRKDFKILIKEWGNVLPERFFLETVFSEKEYFYEFAKLKNSETTFVESGLQDFAINHGVYIDIFPVINVPDNRFKKKLYDAKHFIFVNDMNKLLLSKRSCAVQMTHHGLFYKLCSFAASALVCFKNKRSLLLDREKWLDKVNERNTSSKTSFCGINYRASQPSYFYKELISTKFEGITVSIPKDFDSFLTLQYGDYMTPPPISERVPHHFCVSFSASQSYKTYYKKG